MILVNKTLIISALMAFGEDPELLADLESQGPVDEEFDDEEIDIMMDALIAYSKTGMVSDKLQEAIEETIFQFDPDTANELMVARVTATHGYGWYKK